MDLTRTGTFEPQSIRNEKWTLSNDSNSHDFHVEVTCGKPIDILSLKEDIVTDIKIRMDSVISQNQAFETLMSSNTEKVLECPVCGTPQSLAAEVLQVYGMVYCQCTECSHVFTSSRPGKSELEVFYTKNVDYQSHFANRQAARTRVEQVALPKAQYILSHYERIFGRKPLRILDVGAGSGHFVHSCSLLGIKADGIELSETGRAFGKEYFGIDMYNADFTEQYNLFKDYDIITFWGVVEHVPFPCEMLKAAVQALHGNHCGMVCVEVPKWNSFTVEVQKISPETIIRHLAPSVGHISVYTEKSLACLYRKCGLNITGAWYYGMDFYELLVQLAYKTEDISFMRENKKFITGMQQYIDTLFASDQLVFTGVIG